MASGISVFFKLFLRFQRLMQRNADIHAVRRSSAHAERFYKLPKGVRRETAAFGRETREWLIPETVATPQVLFYIHGGGFVFPLYQPGRCTVAQLARTAGARVFIAEYRLAPEHPFPAAVEDCVRDYRMLIDQERIPPEEIVFAGESAGGNLVVTTLLALREAGEKRLPSGAVSICPVMTFEGEGTFRTADDLMLDTGFVMRMLDAYRGNADPHHPLLSPVYADLTGLPPIHVQAGECEILRSGVEMFVAQAERAGAPVSSRIWPGMWHFWHLFAPHLPEAREAIEEIASFMKSLQQRSPA